MGKWATYRKRGRGAVGPSMLAAPVFDENWTVEPTEGDTWAIESVGDQLAAQMELGWDDVPTFDDINASEVMSTWPFAKVTDFPTDSLIWTRTRWLDGAGNPVSPWSIPQLNVPV